MHGLKLRPTAKPSDLFQCACQSFRVSSELNSRGIREKLSLPAYSSLDQAAKKDPNPADRDQSQAEQRKRITISAAAATDLEQHATDDRQAKNPENDAH